MNGAVKKPNMVALEHARWRLGVIWFVGSAVVFLILMIQSLAGVYEEKVQAVWGWALPNFLPTLMLMMGVFAGTALKEDAETDHMGVRLPFYRLSIALSLFYLACLLAALLVRPFVPTLQGGPVADIAAFYQSTNLWMAPLQGLVGAGIGALFFSKAATDKPPK